MHIKWIILTLSLVSSLSHAAVFRSGREIALNGQFGDNLYAAARMVTAEFNSTDDIFIAARTLNFTAATNADTFLAAGTMSIRDSKSQLLTLAGGTVTITDATAREVIAAAETLRIDRTLIQDDATLFGEAVTLGKNTTVSGSTLIIGNSVVLDGNFTGEVRVYTRNLVIGPSAVIEGELIYRADQADIQGLLKGRTTVLAGGSERPQKPGFGSIGAILFLLGGLFLAPIVVFAFPKVAEQSRQQIHHHFVGTFGRGVLINLVAPIAVFLLIVSVVGTMLGLALIPVLMVSGFAGWSIVAYTLGAQLRTWIRKTDQGFDRREQMIWTMAGSVVGMLFFLLPGLGLLAHVFGMYLGMGALFRVLQLQRSSV